jgi:hypothetical protein
MISPNTQGNYLLQMKRDTVAEKQASLRQSDTAEDHEDCSRSLGTRSMSGPMLSTSLMATPQVRRYYFILFLFHRGGPGYIELKSFVHAEIAFQFTSIWHSSPFSQPLHHTVMQ